jgi:hypothetical protein
MARFFCSFFWSCFSTTASICAKTRKLGHRVFPLFVQLLSEVFVPIVVPYRAVVFRDFQLIEAEYICCIVLEVLEYQMKFARKKKKRISNEISD